MDVTARLSEESSGRIHGRVRPDPGRFEYALQPGRGSYFKGSGLSEFRAVGLRLKR